ncbi:MAG: butyrate kinase [Bacteroidales bacterium]|nr:butyrate kinase [Bacteroidales bacterium]MCF8457417.1 butyrate kinase [Bacteroidales bacterium]
MKRILAINPGSTSTKIAVYENTNILFIKTLRHSTEELQGFDKITDQFEFRKNIILKELENAEIDIHKIAIIIGRGGLVKPIPSGIYEVNEQMKWDMRNSPMGEHASNLGGLIADDIARSLKGVKAYIVDPVVVDELEDVARFSGHPLLQRTSIFHALNQKATARTHAASLDKNYEDMNLIVVHLGGGISVGAHRKGRVVEVNQALDGDGPFSPERTGTLPSGALAQLCFSGKYTHKEVKEMIKGKGGLVAYLGTNEAYQVEIDARSGDKKAKAVQDAMCYQVGKEIGAMAAVLKGDVDAIILTGGIAHNQYLVDYVSEMTGFIAPIAVYPGEDEMKALAMNGLAVLRGEIEGKEYC